jgi:outer membrane immunogenic protein
MKQFHVAAAALTALATTSYAADLPARMPVKAMPAPVVQSWTGCYIGAGGGYGMWNQDHSTFLTATGALEGARTTTGGRGWFGTAQVGCDYQFDQNWVIGAFVDGNWGSLRGDFQDSFTAAIGREKERWSFAGGGRIGYLIYPQLMGFVSAGYTEARFDAFNAFTGVALTNIYPSHTYGGYFIGTGYEYRLAWLPGFTWKTEVRASDYGRDNFSILTPAGVASTSSLSSHKYEQTVRSELVWRFNSWIR